LLDDRRPPPPLTVGEAVSLAKRGAVLLDTRSPEAFASGHLRGSVNVGLDGRFAEYAGDILHPGQEVVLLGDAGRAVEAKVRLARIGFDHVIGAVDGVEQALFEHPTLATTAARVTAADLAIWLAEDPELEVLDVREPGERAGGSLPGARPIPLAQLVDHLDQLDPERPTVVYCAGGHRSSIAASALRAAGFRAVADLIGGYAAWRGTGPGGDAPTRRRTIGPTR
jgi:hydroxyacylglutathione hydrolase